MIGADLVRLVVVPAVRGLHQLQEFVLQALGLEITLFLGDPFMQPEMRFDDEFAHGIPSYDQFLFGTASINSPSALAKLAVPAAAPRKWPSLATTRSCEGTMKVNC